MKLQEGKVPVEGGNVYYRLLTPDSPSRNSAAVGHGRLPLVLLHGGPGFTCEYLEPFSELASDRPVLFYDQLGCGRSDRPEDEAQFPDLFSVERYVRELVTLLDHLELPKVHLHGHSWGSMLALSFALRHAERVSSIVFASPALSITRWVEDAHRLFQRLPSPAYEAFLAGESHPYYFPALHQYYERFVIGMKTKPRALERSEQLSGANVYRYMWGPSEPVVTGVLRDFDETDRMNELDVPCLFVCGRYDEATPETLEWLQQKVSNSLHVVFELSAHHPQLAQTKEYLRVHRSFLRFVEKQRRAKIDLLTKVFKAVQEKQKRTVPG